MRQSVLFESKRLKKQKTDDINDNNNKNNDVDASPVVESNNNNISSSSSSSSVAAPQQPLAARIRPSSLLDFRGQSEALKFLAPFLSPHGPALQSLILWGPPGCGKTTFAKLLARSRGGEYIFKAVSAVTTGAPELKKLLEAATVDFKQWKKSTVLFLDEVHRLNKAQQDVLLPYVEERVLLVACTTENPSFALNTALLSRAKVVVFVPLAEDEVVAVLSRAAAEVHASVSDEVLRAIARMADGDCRTALNTLEMCASLANGGAVDEDLLKTVVQRTFVRYDKDGEQHYDLISAWHKSARAGDPNASLYWTMRMLHGGEKPEYVARRMVRFASEDIGMADSNALTVAINAMHAVKFLGMPECNVHLAHCAIYLAMAKKSVAVYSAMNKCLEHIAQHSNEPPPLEIRNAPTLMMKQLGYSKGYVYTPEAQDEASALELQCLPDCLVGKPPFFDPESILREDGTFGQKWAKK